MAVSRVARFILGFIVLLAGLTIVLAIAGVMLAARGPSVASNSVLWLRVPSGLVERAPDGLFGQLITRSETVGSVVDALRKAKVDDRIAGVVVIPPLQGMQWGKAQEIRAAMQDFSTSGKPLVAYLEYGGGPQYYLATAAEQIFLTPTSPLDVVGVATFEPFLRDALDTLGVYPDILHAGEFKSAPNLYTESTFTPEHRQMTEAINRDLYEQLIGGIADGRGVTQEEARRLVDAGPWLPQAAVADGLIDGLAYEDELVDRMGLDEGASAVAFADYKRVQNRSLGLDVGPAIAIVYISGAITYGASGTDLYGTETAGAQTLVEAIRSARDDAAIRAIVVRIDSPGGAAVASDIIWRELARAREDKPIVVSMSDVAASGGYYVAAPADAIVAQPGTLTGSIGVFAGKFAVDGLLDRLGITVEQVADGEQAGIHSPVEPYSEEARQRIQRQVDAIYAIFLDRVAAGRSMTQAAVDAIGQGRVWTGRQAVEIGLVDELGGLHVAIDLAKARADIDPDSEVTPVVYPRPRSFLEVLQGSVAVSGRVARALAQHPATYWSTAGAAALTEPIRLFHPGEPLALMPIVALP